MQVTSIGVRNFSAISDADVMQWAAATKKQIGQDVRRFWEIPVPDFHLIPATADPGGTNDIDSWVYILNDVQQGESRYGLGWHQMLDNGPIAYVLIDYTRNQVPPQTPSRVFSHEIIEMAIDPAMQMTVPLNGVEYLVEAGDVLSFDAGGYAVDGVLLSGFGTPAYFRLPDAAAGATVFSFRGDGNGDPVGGPLPAKAPEAMGTVLCWLQDGGVKSVLLDAALAPGAFPDPAKATDPPHPGTRRARRTLPADAIGQILLPR
jgi:hypothetical protein